MLDARRLEILTLWPVSAISHSLVIATPYEEWSFLKKHLSRLHLLIVDLAGLRNLLDCSFDFLDILGGLNRGRILDIDYRLFRFFRGL